MSTTRQDLIDELAKYRYEVALGEPLPEYFTAQATEFVDRCMAVERNRLTIPEKIGLALTPVVLLGFYFLYRIGETIMEAPDFSRYHTFG